MGSGPVSLATGFEMEMALRIKIRALPLYRVTNVEHGSGSLWRERRCPFPAFLVMVAG